MRAEVYNSLTEYVHRNESRLVELVEDLDEPTQNKILKSRDCFPTETNLENKMRKTTEYIMVSAYITSLAVLFGTFL